MVPSIMKPKIVRLGNKTSALLVAALLCTGLLNTAQAQTSTNGVTTQKIEQSVRHLQGPNSLSREAEIPQSLFLTGDSLSDHALAEVSGKGVPVNLPSVSRQSNTNVVLWDELQTRSGGKTSVQIGGMNNMQSISMSANR